MKIGLSLSMCVKDIINGIVDENDVVAIISMTKLRNEIQWDKTLSDYCETYWKSNPEMAVNIVRNLLRRNNGVGCIIQPRLDSIEYYGHSIGSSHWIDLS